MIPNLFSKEPIPKNIPPELEKKIKEFSKGKNKEEFLKKSFAYIVKKWYGFRGSLLIKFPRLYYTDPQKILNTKGYMHCTNMNYILRVMAVKSGLFKDSDIELKITTNYIIFLHQYLQIKISKDKYLNIDPWAYQYGIDYGNYATFFRVVRFLPSRKRLEEVKV